MEGVEPHGPDIVGRAAVSRDPCVATGSAVAIA
jgi:hypothetical protein